MAREILSSAVYCRKSPSGFYAFSEALVERVNRKRVLLFGGKNNIVVY